jgi:CDP-paratose 2-epimerase
LGKVDQGVFTFWLASHYFKRPLNYIGFGGHGKQVRDVLHVDDLAQLLAIQIAQLAAPKAGWRGETFNVGGGAHAQLSLCEATELCTDLTGHRLAVGSVPGNRPADVIWYLSDSSRAMKTFGWQPRHAAPAILRDTFTWLSANDAVCRNLFC